MDGGGEFGAYPLLNLTHGKRLMSTQTKHHFGEIEIIVYIRDLSVVRCIVLERVPSSVCESIRCMFS